MPVQADPHAGFPLRHVHLDFHTSPLIPDVGADWDADHFARTLTDAGVASINLFAKCHHGMNYYPSKIGPVHPALKFDLLGAQIEACHRAGIHCPIYLSIGWEVSAAQRHPEWRQVAEDGRLVGGEPFSGGGHNWPWLCVNNGYADELLAQTEEILDRYDCDGFWYDILMYRPDACVCVRCLADMKRDGLDPTDPRHRQAQADRVCRDFMARASGLIRSRVPQAGIFYNSRWGLGFAQESESYSRVEIESLPNGGWGYGFYPLWSRYARTFGLPVLGMTGRFNRSWADWGGLKHPDAQRYEAATILSAGGAVSIGDQLHPRGRLNGAVYEVIGDALRDVRAVESYCRGVRAVSQIGLLTVQADGASADIGSTEGALEGAGKMLLELHQQFDVVTQQCADFGVYEALVLADAHTPTLAGMPTLAARLKQFVAGGGALLLTHNALQDEIGAFLLADEMGVDHVGPAASDPDYFQVIDPSLFSPVVRPGFCYTLYDGPSARAAPRPGTAVLADAWETYFDRTWEHFSSHGYTPPSRKADYPAVTLSGRVAYVYGPIFAAYQKNGSLTFRDLVGGLLRRLLPAPVVETDATPATEVSVLRSDSRFLIHLVNYAAGRRAPGHVEALETPTPLRDVSIRLRCPERVSRVHLARAGTELAFEPDGDGVRVVVPRVGVHEIVVFELEG